MIALAPLCTALLCAAGSNLLLNPSFEDVVADGRPQHWSAFVMPQPGAFAEVDLLAADGTRSAMLHVPNPYDREPANNWSQVIVQDVRDKALVLSGRVRTEAAGEAALWIQCFTQSPARVIAAATTSQDHPLRGTTDWQRLEVEVYAPADTDFVVARCVLKGLGSAWFDSMRLEIVGQSASQLPLIEPAEAPRDLEPVEPVEGGALSQDLVGLSRMLHDALIELETTNQRLVERIRVIQQDIEKSRAGLPDDSIIEPESSVVRHPLVPHGWKEDRQ